MKKLLILLLFALIAQFSYSQKTYYMSGSALLTTAPTYNEILFSVSGNATKSYTYTTGANVPGLGLFTTGNITLYFSILTGGNNVMMRFRSIRVNYSGTVQETTAWSSAVIASAGEKTLTLSSIYWLSGSDLDNFRIEIEFTNTTAITAYIVYRVGDGYSRVDVPFRPRRIIFLN